LVIQIPCFNEEATLAVTLADLPRTVPGFDVVELLVIDDGSSDRTAQVARDHGVHHLVRLPENRGLANAFRTGLEFALRRGADVIVNTDADNQYHGGDIPLLLAPLLAGEADICIGDRNIHAIGHMSGSKKFLQRLGSWVVRQVSSTTVPDTTSGFRAYTREAALRMTIVSEFSYTLESIIQAGKKRMAIAHVSIQTNPRTRESRLFDSISSYIKRSGATIVRIYAMYEPLKIFTYIGLTVLAIGLFPALRFLYFFATDYTGRGAHMQSLIFGAVFMIVGFQILLIGLLADVISANRKMLEDLLYRVRSLELPDRHADAEPVAPAPRRERDAADRLTRRDGERWGR
jgi:glycosyltransferase involved in cell wall biosynthesis